ncbi:MAG: gfo/Idh/MocA family oxidoreductase, partial [Pseudomonadota bacterium]
RKYVDVAGRDGTDHLFLVNGESCEYIDASDAPLPYFARLINDVNDRTETAMTQEHCFKVMELALKAQKHATKLGTLE